MSDNKIDDRQIDPTVTPVPAAPDVVNVGGPERGLVAEVPVVNPEVPTAPEAAGEFSPTQLATHQNPTVAPEIKDYLQVPDQAPTQNLSVPVVGSTSTMRVEGIDDPTKAAAWLNTENQREKDKQDLKQAA